MRLPKNSKTNILYATFIISVCFSHFSYAGAVHDLSFEHAGVTRSYLLYVPSAYTGAKNWPLVINYHGFSSGAENQMNIHSKMNTIADTAHFLIAYPRGLLVTIPGLGTDYGWRVPGLSESYDDVTFTEQMIKNITNDYAIDKKRIHATGWSNGSIMAFYTGLYLPDIIASIAGVSGPLTNIMIDSLSSTRPISVLFMHGTDDPVVPFSGYPGLTGPATVTPTFWASLNDCASDSIVTDLPNINSTDGSDITLIEYVNCNDNTEVLFYRINGGGHGWPGGSPSLPQIGYTNFDINASSEIWNFFKRNPLPEPVIVSPIPENAKVERLTGINFGEGPLWHRDGFLLCSALDGNQVLKIDPGSGTTEVFLSPSGGSNGLAFDNLQRLVMVQRDNRAVSRLEADGTITVLASVYDGKKFNSPNDLAIRSDGTIFFTDPTFSGSPLPHELIFDGVYCITPQGELILLDKSIAGPNGICLSPDEKKLYVNTASGKVIYIFDFESDFSLTNKKLFAVVSNANYVDGMKVDDKGLLYVASGSVGVWIFSPTGVFIDKIPVGGNVTNLNWGDADNQTLFITTINNVYKIRLNAKGVLTGIEEKVSPQLNNFRLLPNYPNPFNPETTIMYELPKQEHVKLTVFDINGREVETLVNKRKNAGRHTVRFNAGNLSSGTYFYKIGTSSGFNKVCKMVLVK